MDVGFVHIGMMKTASSYMQTSWLRNPAYSLSWQGNIKLLGSLRDAVKEGRNNRNMDLDIQTDNPYLDSQKLVISNEGFSTAYMNEIKHQSKIPQFIDYTSRHLGHFAQLSSNLLIVVRDPISWMKSIHIQSIKEGWHGSAQNFVENQMQFLMHSLDMAHILNSYKRYFSNVLVLPYELLKREEDLFWNKISDTFNVPCVTKKVNNPMNASFSLKRVFLLSKLNQLSGCLLNELVHSKGYSNDQEKNIIVSNYPEYGKWAHRRFVEHAEEKALNNIYKLFNLSEPEKNFFEFQISDELTDKIKTNYLFPLREYLDRKYINSYEESLKNHLLQNTCTESRSQ